MTIGQIIKNGNGFEFVELDLTEIGKAVDNVLEVNSIVWQKCVKQAQEFIEKLNDSTLDMHPTVLAKAFFEVVSMKLFEEISGELKKKVFLAKEGIDPSEPSHPNMMDQEFLNELDAKDADFEALLSWMRNRYGHFFER